VTAQGSSGEGADGQSAAIEFGSATRAVMPEDDLVRLFLLRHGEVEGFERRIVRGQIDLVPTERGRGQHERLARFVAERSPRPDLVVTSDLVRCTDLARRVAERCGAELEVHAALREQSMGAWEGLAWDEVSRREGPAINAYWADYFHTAPRGGESMQALFERVAAFWGERRTAWTGRTVAVVTHIGPIRAFLSLLLGTPGTEALRHAPAIASSTEILVSTAGAVLNTLGERPWAFDGASAPASNAADRPVRRIALSGSAGTGKTTLARRVADALRVPYVDEGMRRRLESGLDVHALDAGGLAALIEELWDEQRAAEREALRTHGGYVADRSPLDYVAFWLHYGLGDDVPATERFIARVLAAVDDTDLVVLLPHGVLPLESDGVRTSNTFTQLRFQLLVEGLLERHLPSGRLIEPGGSDDLETRLARVLERVATGH
jgi:broad specificity phosphatase PhoE/nicotinamide riboside kinase